MRILKFLGSLAFALALIAGLAFILSVSTVLESVHGTPFAQENFYQAHWFDFFLGLVWLNIFCATLTRWPFKKKHVGFIITHIGILTLLLGSLGTRVWGREGQMTIFESEAKGVMLQSGFSLKVSAPGGAEKTFPIKAAVLKKPAHLPLKDLPFLIELAGVLPHAVESRTLEEDVELGGSNHALEAELSSEMLGLKQSFVLVERDPTDTESAAKSIGPATFVLESSAQGQKAQSPKLRLTQAGSKTFEIDLDEGLKNADWKEAGLKIQEIRYFPKARVEGSKLVNLDETPHLNPAIEFEITDGSRHTEHHTRFSFFPEFESLRGGVSTNYFDLKVELVPPASPSASVGPSFHFIVSPENKWSYRIHSTKTGESEILPLPLKEPVKTGWMDMVVTVSKTFDHGRIVTNIKEDTDGRSETPAVELRIRRSGRPDETRRLLLGSSLLVGEKNSSVRVSVEPRSMELPFSLGLMDFRKIDYPGTSKPAAFESDVVLRDAVSGVTLEKTIQMNKPLDYLGWRVFQSSFIQDEKLGEASVFTIAKNPGMPAIYGGAALIFLGVILLFYFHPFFTGKKLAVIALLAAGLAFSSGGAEAAGENMRTLAVQHNGRVKPYDSLARQTLKLVSGKGSWQGTDPVDFFAQLEAEPAKIADLRWIRLDLPALKKQLALSDKEHYFSLNDLAPSLSEIDNLVQKAKQDRDRDLKPSKLEQKAEELSLKVRTVQSLISGTNHTKLGPLAGDAQGRLVLEVLYNRIKPFEFAALLYFLAFFVSTLLKKKTAKKTAFILALAAFGFHTFGLGTRIYVLMRPPVSNMYESMIFMNWAVILFALIFWAMTRRDVLLAAGAAMSGLVMLYAHLLPIDSSLDVVVAVLRSNYWLTIHVLTIVSSYGAFGLALALGHRHLFLEGIGKLSKKAGAESAELIFRVLQLGTLLIGTGTFLGGVWANESWGRFWGWDPKETWALITFLGYLLVVHLKYAKKITDYSLALSSVLGFMLVLMTWYGVNFVLGRGLHSYGAGSGGMQWVVYFLVFEVFFVGWSLLKRLTK